MLRLQLRLTPHRRLLLDEEEGGDAIDPALGGRLVEAFGRGPGDGLLRLAAFEVGQALPPVLMWWREVASRYVTTLCHTTSAQDGAAPTASPVVPPPDTAERAALLLTVPPMPGAEYLDDAAVLELWDAIGTAFAGAFASSGLDLQAFVRTLNPAWNLVGRVHFNLAENRRDPEAPFAFMATYTTALSTQAKPQHVPLGQALRQYAGAADKDKLLALLVPVQRAAERCDWLKAMVDKGEIFHPLRWRVGEAARLLDSAGDLENAGVILRMPPNWRTGRPPRPKVAATVGTRTPSGNGLDALLDFRIDVMLEGEPLSEAELAELLAGTESLILLRGQWVEVDRARLGQAQATFEAARRLAERQGLSFAEAMRMLSGMAVGDGADTAMSVADWSQVSAGPWLAETLEALRNPAAGGADPGPALQGSLRPYQRAGVEWLHLLSGLGLGACLADDMGLGKTIQVLSLLLIDQRKGKPSKPSLLVAPASLLANWAAEIEKFAPGLNARILHGSATAGTDLKKLGPDDLAEVDLAITSYGALLRLPILAEMRWRFAILDEAQAIKNADAKQTRAAKAITADARIALTGTPVENHLGDLWSIFDFINPGLLGGAKAFGRYVKKLADRPDNPYGPLRELVRPYILRRMKTDKSVIADLPEKTEIKALCGLTPKQAALYAQSVSDLAEALEGADGIRRSGIVLSTLMRLKQICNHPSQWLNDGRWDDDDSGKLFRLREIAEVIAARQEKMLVFTQFREMTEPLSAFLARIFGRSGLVLHGDTPVKDRKALVKRFQDDEDVPFFVLSLKAGGSGLTLTAASHVVHFDRWWNPAVENQATDRAFRIGQKRNVMVHKFVCRGTVEEKIDTMIAAKAGLSDEILAPGGEVDVTTMSDADLLKLVALDLNAATGD